jgi:hypothetical protein
VCETHNFIVVRAYSFISSAENYCLFRLTSQSIRWFSGLCSKRIRTGGIAVA